MQFTLGDWGLGDVPARESPFVETLTREQVFERVRRDHEWKMNGLATHLLAKSKAKRVEWLAGFQRKNGKELTDDLKSRLLRLHEARKSSRPAS